MNLIVAPVPDGTILLDMLEPLTVGQIHALMSSVYAGKPVRGFCRYRENFSIEEKNNMLSAGAGIITVGIARTDSMANPSAELGARDGKMAVGKLLSLDIPLAVTAAVDDEGPKHNGLPIALYTNAWYAELIDGAHGAPTDGMLYEGWGLGLTGEQLYRELSVPGYWASSPNSIPPARRGFKLVQIVEDIVLAGVRVDVDQARTDKLGGQCHWFIDGDQLAAA